jgi:hypothetical protein
MMYGERRVLRPPGLLMDAHKRVCEVTEATKIIVRPEWVDFYNIPHFLHCTNEGGGQMDTDQGSFRGPLPEYTIHLLHYYGKSVEEFLVKLEQSIPPYIRYLPDAYNLKKHCDARMVIEYEGEYDRTVHSLMERFWRASAVGGDGGDFLGPPPEFPRNGLEHYDLYIFFKLRVAMRDEWDEEGYLRENQDVEGWVANGWWQDGLQQFLTEGFESGRKSCWVRDGTIRFCIPP